MPLSLRLLFFLLLVLLPALSFAVVLARGWTGILSLLKRKPHRLFRMADSRPVWMFAAGYALVSLAALFDAAWIEPDWIQVERTVMETRAPILGRDVFKILHLTDLHLEGLGDRERAALDLAGREEPDLIVLTGDMANTREGLAALPGFLAGLKARQGILAVEGHFDHKFDLRKVWADAGVQVLTDEFTRRSGPGRSLIVAGLADPPSRPAEEVLADAPTDDFRVVLSHRPDPLAGVSGKVAHLALCGHTHGGQIGLPFLGPAHPAWWTETGPYRGETRRGGTVLIVNRGLGMTGGPIPRLRLLSRPEIRVIEVRVTAR